MALNVATWQAEPGNSGSPFLFIHGITDRHETWSEVAGGIRRGASAIAPDLRGHSRSGRTNGNYHFTDYPQDLISLIESGADLPVHIVGHSLGAIVAVQVAVQRPDLVNSLVLEDPPFYFQQVVADNPKRADNFRRNARLAGSGLTLEGIAAVIREFAPDLPEDSIQASAHALFVTDAPVIKHALDLITDSSPEWINRVESVLTEIRCPTLLLQGSYELEERRPLSVMRPQDADQTVALIPDCKREFWSDWGHLLHNSDPQRFIAQVTRFIDSLPSAS